jgi:3-oxoacyl-[acyl-carrier protein] reductase
MADLDGHHAVITGAGHGIGRATARLFAERGARLVLGDINPDTLAEAATEVEKIGARVLPVVYDQRRSESVAALFEAAFAELGHLDSLANIAGIYPFSAVADTTDELWADVLGTNLTGVFYCCREAFPAMVARGSGCIVNIASGAAEIPYAGASAYSASKGGIEALTRVLAKEGAPGVRVNTVAPGPTQTWPPQEDAGAGGGTDNEDALSRAAQIIDNVPLGRWGRPEEIAAGIAFLVSDEATFITGQVLRVNGGNHML